MTPSLTSDSPGSRGPQAASIAGTRRYVTRHSAERQLNVRQDTEPQTGAGMWLPPQCLGLPCGSGACADACEARQA